MCTEEGVATPFHLVTPWPARFSFKFVDGLGATTGGSYSLTLTQATDENLKAQDGILARLDSMEIVLTEIKAEEAALRVLVEGLGKGP